ncbi:DUF485 domain-containing protein [Acetobacteraceae bacterium KSS8]|uniref:DUF485 domain-containing protein n=1 Tax=Endosaccharibacter trunci TaxID=2812733 RepID=A0ABT1WD07_9PROT|nr:DUF485 domain-containing protein [Acetobacteraceae bacterium KSS8]
MPVEETPAGRTEPGLAAAIAADPAFRVLAQRRARLGLSVVIPTMVIYFGYLAVLVSAPELLRMRLGQATTLGLPLGFGVMVATFLLVLFYVRRAGSDLDRLTQTIIARHAR